MVTNKPLGRPGHHVATNKPPGRPGHHVATIKLPGKPGHHVETNKPPGKPGHHVTPNKPPGKPGHHVAPNKPPGEPGHQVATNEPPGEPDHHVVTNKIVPLLTCTFPTIPYQSHSTKSQDPFLKQNFLFKVVYNLNPCTQNIQIPQTHPRTRYNFQTVKMLTKFT